MKSSCEPRLKGETIDGTYYLEGSDYAKETAEESERQRQMIRDAIYAEKQEKRDLALAEKIAEKAEETRAKREKAETERQKKPKNAKGWQSVMQNRLLKQYRKV